MSTIFIVLHVHVMGMLDSFIPKAIHAAIALLKPIERTTDIHMQRWVYTIFPVGATYLQFDPFLSSVPINTSFMAKSIIE